MGLSKKLNQAQTMQRAAMEGTDDGTSDECLKQIAAASVAETEAVELDYADDAEGALAKFRECVQALTLAIKAKPASSADREALGEHKRQVEDRIEYLTGLGGKPAEVGVGEQIHPVELELQKNKK